MEYRELSSTGLEVSLICLGTMTWGEQNTEEEAHAQLDCALDHGVNFVDTAELYPVPPKGDTHTLSESYIGRWLQIKRKRDKVVLATKISGRAPYMGWIRDGKSCFNKENINQALNASLKRLKTDYIDLYQLHWPDRKTNFFGQLGYKSAKKDNAIPIEETLEALDEVVRSGKVRYIGLSNETPWGVMEFLKIAQNKKYPRVVSVQNPYSLLNRTYEVGLAEVSHREGTGLLAYSPLGFGTLTGKYLTKNVDPNSRLVLFKQQFQRYTNIMASKAVAEYVGIAKKYDLSPTQMALAFVNQQPFVTSNIIGATNLSQLEENLNSVHIKLSKEIIQEINKVHVGNPNPSP